MKSNPYDQFRTECAAFFDALYVDEHKILVFGEGNPGAKVMMIGEAPGEQESLLGRPFVGKAGKNLDAFIQMTGLNREDMYITNTVKFRPVKRSASGRASNRPPTREEIALMLPWLVWEIGYVNPQVIVTLGNVPLRALMGPGITIGQAHGTWLTYQGINHQGTNHKGTPLFPLYHPAALIYNPQLEETYRTDVLALSEMLCGNAQLKRF